MNEQDKLKLLEMKPSIDLDLIVEFEVMETRRPGKGFRINPDHYSTSPAAAYRWKNYWTPIYV